MNKETLEQIKKSLKEVELLSCFEDPEDIVLEEDSTLMALLKYAARHSQLQWQAKSAYEQLEKALEPLLKENEES